MNTTHAASASSNACFSGIFVYRFNYMTTAYFFYILASCTVNVASAIFGAVANVLVILAVKRNTTLHTNANFVLVVQAVSDLLTSCLTQPTLVAVLVEALLKRASCVTAVLFTAFRSMTAMASLFATLGVSVERTLALMASYWYVEHVTPFRLVAPLACAWLMFMALDAARLLDFPPRPIAMIRALLFLACLLATLVCYLVLVKTAKRHRREIAAQIRSAQAENARKKKIRENKCLNMAIYVISAALVGYLPLIIGLSVMSFTNQEPVARFTINAWMGTALFLNACVNPLVYCWRNSTIRKAIVKMLKRGQTVDSGDRSTAAGTSGQ